MNAAQVAAALVWTEVPKTEGRVHFWKSEAIDFGFTDAYGRKVGALAKIFDYADGARPGLYVLVQGTRNGHVFGASPGSVLVEPNSFAVAKALAARKIVECEKRLARAAAKGNGRQWARKGGSS